MARSPGWEARMRIHLAITLAIVAAPAMAQDPVEGAALFQGFCAACHGHDARGDGPMAAILEVLPADLTALSAENGGTFPAARVAQRIDGRDPLLAHGGPMPLFGEFFAADPDAMTKTEAGQPMLTSRPIADLIAWLETIQE